MHAPIEPHVNMLPAMLHRSRGRTGAGRRGLRPGWLPPRCLAWHQPGKSVQ